MAPLNNVINKKQVVNTLEMIMESLRTNVQINISTLSKPGTFITHNATKPLSDINGGNLSDHMQLPLDPRKVLY